MSSEFIGIESRDVAVQTVPGVDCEELLHGYVCLSVSLCTKAGILEFGYCRTTRERLRS